MKLSNKTYDILKFIDIRVLPATITHTTNYYYENSGGSVNAPQSINYVRIYKVLGYK